MSQHECATIDDAQEYTWELVSDGTPVVYEPADPDLDRQLETGRGDTMVTLYAPSTAAATQGSEREQLDRKPIPPSQSAQEWIESTLDVE